MSNLLLIHNDNIANIENYQKQIRFTNIQNVLDELKEILFDTIFIKDSLSDNYLELQGVELAYHIRLSQELRAKHLSPIVILSDIDSYTLNKLNPIARILFTKNIYLISNTTEAIQKFQTRTLKPLKESEFNTHFLDLITVAPPENSTSHSIANEWAIERWANLLNLDTPAIRENRDKISSMLYVKHLRYKYNLENSSTLNIKKKSLKGKLLFIDDR